MSVTPDEGRTHWHGCEQERGHHACALAELARLRAHYADAIDTLNKIGAPFGLQPTNSGQTLIDAVTHLRASLARMLAMHDLLMSKVNHRASVYDAECIREMNEAPMQARKAIRALAQEPPA